MSKGPDPCRSMHQSALAIRSFIKILILTISLMLPCCYESIVVGGGPVGLVLTARLIKKSKGSILWIGHAPLNGAGRLSLYPTVPSNTKVSLFRNYFQHIYNEDHCRTIVLPKHEDHEHCLIGELTNELQKASEYVKEHCDWLVGHVISLEYNDKVWHVNVQSENSQCSTQTAKSVYLATGAHPKTLSDINSSLSLECALDFDCLGRFINSKPRHKNVAIVGNSHSAVLVMRNLHALRVPFTVYAKRPFIYAQYVSEDHIINDDTGLKGLAAQWAKEHEHDLKIIQCKGEEDWKKRGHSIIIGAIGFERNELPNLIIDGFNCQVVGYDGETAVVHTSPCRASHLFGYGIAFPKISKPPFETAPQVGLWKFMRYILETI